MIELMHKVLGMPELASKHGADVDRLIIYVHLLMIVLFVGWGLYLVYALFRFRRAANPKADYVGIRGHLSNYIEVAVAFVEAVLLVGFAVPLWGRAVDQFPKPEEATQVRVIAQQFNWNVFYPGKDNKFGDRDLRLVSNDNPWGLVKDDPKGKDDITPPMGVVHVPVNKPVIIYLTSKDVIHSFKVIAMRVTQDAIPGLLIPVHFTPTTVGTYQINCAQLCGNGHSSMAMGRLIVESQEDFDKWMASQTKGGGATSFE
jgi:cytochrome c oxidase subunit II